MRLAGFCPRLILVLLVSSMLASPLLVHAAPAPFILQVSPTQQVVAAGSTASLNVTVTSTGGFAGTVTVDQISPITISTSLFGAPHNFTLDIGASKSYIVPAYTKLDQLGTFDIYFKATSQPMLFVQYSTVTLTTLGEPDFIISAGPSPPIGCPFGCNVNITAGATKRVTVIVQSYYNFTGPVTLSATLFAGTNQLSMTLNPRIVTPAPNKTVTSTLTITEPATATYGGNWVFVNGTSNGTVRSTPLIVTVPMSFSFTSGDSPVTVKAGSTASTPLTLTTNGFTRALNITTTTPTGLAATLDQDRTSVNRTITSFTTTLTVTASPATPPGTYYLNITGTTVIQFVPISGGGAPFEKAETSNSTMIPVIVQASQLPQPPPRKILGLDPAIFYSLAGSTAVLGAIALVLVVLKRRSRLKPPGSTSPAPSTT